MAVAISLIVTILENLNGFIRTDENIIKMAKEGKTVIMVSSEMPELLGVCDRIIVMSGGKISGEVDPETATQEEIMALAAKFA